MKTFNFKIFGHATTIKRSLVKTSIASPSFLSSKKMNVLKTNRLLNDLTFNVLIHLKCDSVWKQF